MNKQFFFIIYAKLNIMPFLFFFLGFFVDFFFFNLNFISFCIVHFYRINVIQKEYALLLLCVFLSIFLELNINRNNCWYYNHWYMAYINLKSVCVYLVIIYTKSLIAEKDKQNFRIELFYRFNTGTIYIYILCVYRIG